MSCKNCHAPQAGDPESEMLAVGNPSRRPWVDEPRCDNCHHRPGYQYEQANTLYRDSVGHGGVYCEACHNSTHAITPARNVADNVQSITLQGLPGSIWQCTVCHPAQPKGAFRHAYVPAQ